MNVAAKKVIADFAMTFFVSFETTIYKSKINIFVGFKVVNMHHILIEFLTKESEAEILLCQ